MSNADDIVTGSMSIENVTLESGSTAANLGDGADNLTSSIANFDGFNTLDDDDKDDDIILSDNSTMTDNLFTSVSSFETLTLANGGPLASPPKRRQLV